MVTWDDVYQPTFTLPATAVLGVEPVNAGVNDQDVHSSDHHPPLCHAANRTTESSSTASPVTVPVTPPLAPPTVVGDGSSETSGDETSGDETDMSPSEVRFPYTSKVGERIKRLVAAKNATAARGYIPSDQDIAAAEGADITRLGLRNPWAKKKLFYCRFKARLIDGTWDYSDLPCHEEEGQNIGYSTRDDLVRHLREHHYEMVRPPEKKKVRFRKEVEKAYANHFDREKEKWRRVNRLERPKPARSSPTGIIKPMRMMRIRRKIMKMKRTTNMCPSTSLIAILIVGCGL